MELGSEQAVSVQSAPMLSARPKQRRHFRQKIHNLAYINLDYTNGGIIRNLSESGVAIQAVSPVQENQEVQLRFELLNPRTRVEATGRVAWTDTNGQAGVEFMAGAPRSRRQLREWLFTQLLGSAEQATNTESIFLHKQVDSHPAELVFSHAVKPALQFDVDVPSVMEDESVAWCPVPRSPHTLARMIDGLIIASSVLLFCVLSVAITHVFPTWWLGLGLIAGAGCAFSGVYWFLFVWWVGETPGNHLAQLAGGVLDQDTELESEEESRFR